MMDDTTKLLRDLKELHCKLGAQIVEAQNTVLAARLASERLLLTTTEPKLQTENRKSDRLQQRLLSTSEVLMILGISKMTLWRMRVGGSFPPPVKISQRRIAWHADTIEKWIVSNRVT